ncbi:hypothetical protein, partial [Desulfosporosinus nitroreducens]
MARGERGETPVLLSGLAMTYFPRSYAPSILGPGTKGTIVSCGQYRRATHPKGRLRGEGKLFATLRLITHSPAVWIRTGGPPHTSILIYNIPKHRETISLEIVSRLLPGDDLLSQEL